ncbi:MAG TPA: hypothetical protein VEX38_00895, partial [Fimbriimonadaceae bacterium]|nr:hypothetical protein [Fimbriimonadaceae bacterium]
FLYYTRTEEGKQYPIYARKKIGSEAEEVLLDVNQLAEGQKFMAVGSFSISPDGNRLAYSTDNTGYRQYKLHVKNLKTGKREAFEVERVTSVTWAADNETLFYATEDDVTKRSDMVWRQRIGYKPELLLEEKDAL